MRMPVIDDATLAAATAGDLAALDRLLVAIQPAVFNLAVRMLGNRDDASDATQEILLRTVTRLSTFRGESAFGTWVFSIARHHLLSAITRTREQVSLDALAERLQQGLAFGAVLPEAASADRSLTPEDKLAARQVALGCTQGMLMSLDREQRLAWVLDTVFDVGADEGGRVLGIRADAYRKRLSRARAALEPFMRGTCGLANADAPCRCERQLPALRHVAAGRRPAALVAEGRAEIDEAARHFDALVRMGDAVAVFRAHPEYRIASTRIDAIRAVLRAEGYLDGDEPRRTQ